MESRRLRWAFGAVTLLLLVAIVRACGATTDDDPTPPLVSADDHSAPPVEATAVDVPTHDLRSPAEAAVEAGETPEPVDLDHPFAFELRLRVLDAFGLPVPDANVFVAPPQCGFSRWPDPTDGCGRLTLSWSGRARHMRVVVGVIAWGLQQPMRAIDLDAGAPRTLTVVAAGKRQSEAVRMKLQERTPEEAERAAQLVRRGRLRRSDDLDILCGRTLLLFEMFDCTNCHDASAVRAYAALARASTATPGLHTFARFADLPGGTLAPAQPAPAGPTRRGPRSPRSRPEQPGAPPDEEPAAGTLVVGVVRNPDLSPAAQVPVAWLSDEGALIASTSTAVDGTYQLGPIPPGHRSLYAGGGDLGTAASREHVFDCRRQVWNPTLVRNAVGHGVVRDEAGAPLVGFCVEVERSENEWADLATTAGDGSFVLPDLPGIADCVLWPDEARNGLPLMSGAIVLPDGAETVLALQPGVPTRARLRLHPVPPASEPGLQVEVRVHQIESGRVAWLLPNGKDNSFELGTLPPGAYHIEVGAPVIGWIDAGVAQLDGRGLWDMGRFVLPAPGHLRIVRELGAPAVTAGEHALYRRTEATDVLASYRLENDGTMLVPPGELLLLWRDGAGAHAVGFRIASDQHLTLDVRGR
ncbi:MAG TPA: carboxypeptidase-like regulatory domain-containing protein [Planctomycetota bacterium]|nr:carboxypeptidase-like regulatory domain-containing protein [Planctomycetota bacterium]